MGWEAAIPAITAGIGAAGQIAAARQAGRQAQAQAQVPVDTLNQRAYETDISSKQRGLEANDAALLARALGVLQERADARSAQGARATNSVRGDILANVQDVNLDMPSRIPKFEFSGGLRPSLLSGNTRQLGGEMSRQALMEQLKGDPTPFSDLPKADFSSVINAPGAPKGTPLPEGSRMDSILQAIGQYGGLAAGVMQGMGGQAQTPSTQMAQGPVGAPQQMFGTPVAMPGPPPVNQPSLIAGTRPIGPGMAPTARMY